MAVKNFILKVEYGTGSANMLVDTCDLIEAIKLFKAEVSKNFPDGDKSYGMPQIISARIEPIMYESIYKGK